tara:strand:+ start:259 stop:393 length:135 start_codon:yes stop_codon:yes gene_type:complete
VSVQARYALYVSDLLIGEKNGNVIGSRSSIVPNVVLMLKRKKNE